jgi:CO dehydrogenase nickel-insertion accessory protein CooC1
MLIVSDPTPTGLKSARRISEMANGLDVVRGRMGLVMNRVADIEPNETQAREVTGLELWACVPSDPMVADYELRSEPLMRLPDDSAAVVAVGKFLESVMQKASIRGAKNNGNS